MTPKNPVESDASKIIEELHRIRETIVDSFGGDLHKLAADARERQDRSGRPVWRTKPPAAPLTRQVKVEPAESKQ